MRTLVLPQNIKNNCNYKAFWISLAIYLPVVIMLFLSYKEDKTIEVGSEVLYLKMSNIVSSNISENQSISQKIKSAKINDHKRLLTSTKPKEFKVLAKKEKIKAKAEYKEQAIAKRHKANKANKDNKLNRANKANDLLSAGGSSRSSNNLVYGKDANAFLFSIKKAIDNNLDYPRQARLLKKQGIVLLKFMIMPNKNLENIEVVGSSGHVILDKSAIKTIKMALADFPMNHESYTITIPIEYKIL